MSVLGSSQAYGKIYAKYISNWNSHENKGGEKKFIFLKLHKQKKFNRRHHWSEVIETNFYGGNKDN